MTSSALTEGLQETLAVFGSSGRPRTTTEVATELDLGRRSTYDRLQRLVDRDCLATKKVGASARVWWRPATSDSGPSQATSDRVAGPESLVDDVLDCVAVGIFALDEEFRFMYVNTRAESLLGASEDELRAHAVWEVLPVDETDPLGDALRTAMATGNRQRRERYVEDEESWQEIRVYPSAGGLSARLADITEKKTRERELQRYQTVFEQSRDVNAVVDEKARFQTITASVENVLGYAPGELVDDVGFEYIHPDDRKEVVAEFSAMVADPGYEPTIEFRFEHNDGTWVALETQARNLIDDPGIAGIVVYTREVTARNEREHKLQQQVRQQEVVTKLGQNALESRDVDALMSEATRLVSETLDSDFCKVLDLDAGDESLHLRAGVGWDENVVGSATVSAVDDNSQAAHTLGTGEPVVVQDLKSESRFSGPALLTDHGVRSGISVLVGPPDDPWGILGIHDSEPATFSDDEVNFVQSVANVLAGALDRQTYEQELVRQRCELQTRERALRHASRVMSRPENSLSAPLDELLDILGETLGVEDAGLATVTDGEWAFERVQTQSDAGGSVPTDIRADCTRVAESGQQVVSGPAEQQSFLGVPVAVDGEVYGVLCCWIARESVSFTDWETAFVELVANWIGSEYQRQQYTDRLAALNELNTVAREITDAVIDQSTRGEIEQTVCEHLAATESYLFAWVGDVDVATQTVDLHAEAGVEGYLDDITITVDPDDERSDGPTGRALRTGEVQVTRDIRTDDRHDPWRGYLQTFDVRSSAAIPVVHEGSLYGVLNVYAGRPHAFEGEEATVLRQLGEVVGHAIAATERKQALMSDEVVELEFQIPALRATFDTKMSLPGRVELAHAVPVRDDEYLIYGTATAEGMESLQRFVDVVPHWESVTTHGEGVEGNFELRLSEPPVLSAVASVGGYINRAILDDGELTLSLRLSPSADVRRVIDAVQTAHPTAELLKRRQRTLINESTDGLESTLTETLTDRQRTVLQAAYHAGFFEWPRDVSGETIAESLDISAPTFHQHLRKAEQTVFETLLTNPLPLRH
ncbi:GAF domain-containing protein [Salinibaculum salinum]|uniref:GAF domain-containing protein n=1 Tax=Salinibaculum salinum TaxID=3131996 RepID=UPI0030EC6DAC